MVPPRPKTHSRLRNGRNHAVCVHPFRGGTKWGITVAPSVGNYLGPATGEFTLVLMARIGDIPWPSTPRSSNLLVRVRGVFHCLHRIQRSFRRSHASSSSKVLLTAASLKYWIQPVRSGARSAITCPTDRPRPFRSSSWMRLLSRCTDAGAIFSLGFLCHVIE